MLGKYKQLEHNTKGVVAEDEKLKCQPVSLACGVRLFMRREYHRQLQEVTEKGALKAKP